MEACPSCGSREGFIEVTLHPHLDQDKAVPGLECKGCHRQFLAEPSPRRDRGESLPVVPLDAGGRNAPAPSADEQNEGRRPHGPKKRTKGQKKHRGFT